VNSSSERALLVELSELVERVGVRRGSDRGRCRLALWLELVEARVLIGLALGSLEIAPSELPTSES
jgi:hypothetical protein